MKNKLLLCVVFMAAVGFADSQYEFNQTKNPLKELNVSEVSVPLLDKKLKWADGVLNTSDNFGCLYAPEEFKNGRLTLSGYDRYKSSIALVARARKDFGAFYALEVNPSQKTVAFYRYIYPEKLVKQEFPYDGNREFSLALDFNGKTIVAWANGKKVGEFPDDGRLKSGVAGIRCGYWTNAILKQFGSSSVIPEAAGGEARKTAPTAEQKPSPTTGGFSFLFDRETDPLRVLTVASNTMPLLGTKVTWEKGILYTKDNHAVLLTPKTVETGRVTLAGRDKYQSSIALIAHARKDAGAFYSLEVNPSRKTVVYSRFIYGEPGIKKEFAYDGGPEFTLSLDFNGKTIVAWANGKKLGEFPDDGRLKSGFTGIRSGYWTNVELKKLEYTPEIPAESKPVAQVLFRERSNVKPLDMKKLQNWDLARASRVDNGMRSQISLNQLWSFQPVSAYAENPRQEESEWGYFPVPGYWAKGATGNYMRDSAGRAIVEWRSISYQKGGVGAWYKRTFDVPADWRGKKVELLLEDVCGTADIFLGAEKVGEKRDPLCGLVRLDLSTALQYGKCNELRICSGSKIHATAGLGNASLLVRPATTFGDPGISTRVSSGTLELAFRGQSVPADSFLNLIVRDRQGKELFQEKRPFADTLMYKWRAPVLWSPDTPELYFMDLTLTDRQGKVLDRNTIRFGYREFAARDGRFFLNGNPIVLKAETAGRDKGSWWGLDFQNDPAFMAPLFAMLKQVNLNCTYLTGSPADEILDLADEMGIMLLVKGPFLSHSEMDGNPEQALKRLETLLREMQNNPVYTRHPAQIGFLIDVWYGYNAGCTNPNYIGRSDKDPNQHGIPALRSERLNRLAGLYKKYFPEHECFTGGSGKVGNVYGTHVYHTWGAPSTELRALFEDWSRKPEVPIFVGETFLPYIGSFFDLENFHGGGVPYVTENSARILGPGAYEYRTTLSPRPFHERSSNGWFWNSSEAKDGGTYGFAVDNATAVIAKYIEEIMPGWRFHRLTGYGNFDYTEASFAMQRIASANLPFSRDYGTRGFKPDAFDNGNARTPCSDLRVAGYDLRPSLLFAPFARAMATVSAAIFDKSTDPLLQNHSGYSGDTLEKSVILFNDSPETVRLQLALSISDNQNRTRSLGSRTVEAKPFEHKRIPVSVKLPSTGNRSEWTLHADFSGAKNMRLQFPFQVFARPAALELNSPVSIWDPEGVLTRKLEKRLTLNKLDSLDALPNEGILIVGRGALSRLKNMPDWSAATAAGLNILVMEQLPDASPELQKTRTRRVFRNAPAHPAFEGLEDVDFEFWQDSYAIAPAKVKDGAGINWSDWGNRNMVAAYVFRRPQYGNWISLLVSGFDLFQSPLLEQRSGKGNLIASQLEITERLGSDPAATRLFDNLLRYLDRPAESGKTLFFGKADGARFLEKFGVAFQQTNSLAGDVLKDVSLLIVSAPDWARLREFRKELSQFVYFGGRVLYLHAGGTFDPSWLPFTMNQGEAKAPRAAISGTADGVWQNGFGNAELYWRETQTVPVFQNVPPHFDATNPAVLVRGKFGTGEWIFTTLSPELFKESAAIGKSVRLFSALFTSLGAKIKDASTPYASDKALVRADLSEQKWEFAIDKNQVGLTEKWQEGKGNGQWMKGLIADGIEVRVGQPFESFLRYDYNGVAWYRLTFDVPDELLQTPERFFVAGAIDDLDEVYLNGVKIGATGKETPKYWIANRNYPIPAGLLKKNGNLLVVRVVDESGGGGIVKGPVAISARKLEGSPRQWQTPYPEGARRDYECKPDIVRMY